jgi:hypothetical protein
MNILKVISVADAMSWRVEEQKEGNKNLSLVGYRKYLDESLLLADESKNYIEQYYETLEHFKMIVGHKIETTLSGEYFLKHSKRNGWHHRQKDTIIKSYFEFILKRVCLKNDVDFIESLRVVFDMKNEQFLSEFLESKPNIDNCCDISRSN